MPIEIGDVFVINYTLKDGSMERHHHRCDGRRWQGELVAMRFLLP